MQGNIGMKVEHIVHQGQTLAVIFYSGPIDPGVHFYVDDTNALQVGNQRRRKGELIKPHRHLSVQSQHNGPMQEVLYIEEGKVKIQFFNSEWEFVADRVICRGDMVLLINGGHGFEMLEETRMVEIKQGPYNPLAVERK